MLDRPRRAMCVAPMGRITTGKAITAGVFGWPAGHSRSPQLHGHWLERYGIDGAYVPLPVPPDQFEAALRGLMAAGFAGANVTLPHKEAAFALVNVTTSPWPQHTQRLVDQVFSSSSFVCR